LVVDTDVLIDYLRDQPQAVVFLEGTEQPLAISAITVAELHANVRDGEEGRRLDAFVAASGGGSMAPATAPAWRMP
jgi:predicted nucleic acid-binding protein